MRFSSPSLPSVIPVLRRSHVSTTDANQCSTRHSVRDIVFRIMNIGDILMSQPKYIGLSLIQDVQNKTEPKL